MKRQPKHTETWKVYSLDVWGNDDDGYNINDYYPQGETEIPVDADDRKIISALRASGHIDQPLKHSLLDIDASQEDVTLITYRGRPELELRKKGAW